jgi:hypothetical protein
MIDAVTSLALAYHVTGKEEYAEAAVKHLRVFFLDPATRMNPNLQYSQAIMGQNSGRGIGIIDTLGLRVLPDCITLISGSRFWTSADRKAMTAWWHDYAQWLRESPNGIDERRQANNHGVNYDLQLASVLLGAGDEAAAREVLGTSLPARMDAQIRPDGQMPLEEARRTSWHYCSFNLRSLCEAGVMGNALGLDLWKHEAPDGSGSIRRAMLFLIPFIGHQENWKFTEISDFSEGPCRLWLAIGSAEYDDSAIRDAQRVNAPLSALSLTDWLRVPIPVSGEKSSPGH